MLYQRILKPILFRFSPDRVHDFFVNLGEFLGQHTLTRQIIAQIYDYRGPNIGRTIDGLYYRTPLVLSAGFDYNARLTQILPALGFGGVEVGSVTARPCFGNPSPQLKRLPHSKSIVVNKGLKNDGVDAIIQRLKSKPQTKNFVIGISIARTNDAICTETEEGIADYLYSLRRLCEEAVGDYYTINISCPNTFGGETFANVQLLEPLLTKLKTIPCSKPIYVKMPINLPWLELDQLIAIVENLGYQGIVIGNLNKDYSYVANDPNKPDQFRGGLSGQPCFELSNQLIRKAHEKYGQKLTIIGCGGIMSPQDAETKLALGADLLQLITGMIFEGPGLVKRICKVFASNPL